MIRDFHQQSDFVNSVITAYAPGDNQITTMGKFTFFSPYQFTVMFNEFFAVLYFIFGIANAHIFSVIS